MSVFIKTANGDIIGFDAVTSYKHDYNSKVTEHPLESGANVTDHVIKENLKIMISGVFSDYSPGNLTSFNIPLQNDPLNSNSIVNSRDTKPIYVINAGYGDRDVIGHNYVINTDSTLELHQDIVRDKLIKMQRAGEVVTLFELEGSGIKQNGYFPNAVITGLGFNEDDSSGEALYVTMQVSIVTFADTESVAISGDIIKAAATDQEVADAASGGEASKKDIKSAAEVGIEAIRGAFGSRGNGNNG